MAKTGLSETDQSLLAAKTLELKNQLQRLVKAIFDEDDYTVDTIEEAITLLYSLRNLKPNKSISLKSDKNISVPEEFKCPISKELMKDPVVLSTGQTYDRPFIQRWLNEGKRTCPQTNQVLSHIILTPNHLVQEMISQWCNKHGLQLPKTRQDVDDQVITDADHGSLISLLDKMSSCLLDQKEAAKRLRLLTKKFSSFRAVFSEVPHAITQLLSPILAAQVSDIDPDVEEDLITTLLNLSINEDNKHLIAKDPIAIPQLIQALRSRNIRTKSNAAAALFSLSVIDANKVLIGQSLAMHPLVELLDEGDHLALKDAASAIFNLCIAVENRERAVSAGAIRVSLKKIADGIFVDELLAILTLLSSHQRATEELKELDAVQSLLAIMRDTASERNKENCIAILHTICHNSRTKMMELREEEMMYGTISKIAESGTSTSRAKRKANGILERLARVATTSDTA